MTEYLFTLRYALKGSEKSEDALIGRLSAAGCDDALVGLGQPGRIALEFSREGASAFEVLGTALRDVKKALPSAQLIEATPDWVGLTDVAAFLDISRQAVRKLRVTHSESFPLPMHEGTASIWHLAEVLDWFQAKGGYCIDANLREMAHATLRVNLEKEVSKVRGATDAV